VSAPVVAVYAVELAEAGVPVYVGSNRRPLCQRLADHRYDARRRPRSPFHRLLARLLADGAPVAIRPLAEFPTAREALGHEAAVIGAMRAGGLELANAADPRREARP
jgi:hypothetical protein